MNRTYGETRCPNLKLILTALKRHSETPESVDCGSFKSCIIGLSGSLEQRRCVWSRGANRLTPTRLKQRRISQRHTAAAPVTQSGLLNMSPVGNVAGSQAEYSTEN